MGQTVSCLSEVATFDVLPSIRLTQLRSSMATDMSIAEGTQALLGAWLRVFAGFLARFYALLRVFRKS